MKKLYIKLDNSCSIDLAISELSPSRSFQVCYKHSLLKTKAAYLVNRAHPDLWNKVLQEEDCYKLRTNDFLTVKQMVELCGDNTCHL